jgi:molybdate transport system regulatory protein
VQFRPRIFHQGEIALGPGKADLLAAIEVRGSIARGAKNLGMSYMRAWTLVKIMNDSFREPLVEVDRGGARGGAAHLTSIGQEVLALYRTMIEQSEKASRKTWVQLRRRLKS